VFLFSKFSSVLSSLQHSSVPLLFFPSYFHLCSFFFFSMLLLVTAGRLLVGDLDTGRMRFLEEHMLKVVS